MSEIDDYDYELPEDLIAQWPQADRHNARMMVVDRRRQMLTHWLVRNLAELLRPADVLVINETRVVAARLLGARSETGGRWEGLFLAADERGWWRILSRTRGKPKPGETIRLLNRFGRDDIELRLVEKDADGVWTVEPLSREPWHELLDRVGRVPLPPYIRGGEMREEDRDRYQTVYARKLGSAAAPTAGLHFTPKLLSDIEEAGIAIARLTLHVGLDTFRTIKRATLAEHRMHREWGEIDEPTAELIRERRAAGGRIVAVGTTSVRVLETASRGGELRAWSGETDLFIRPPYEFRAVDALLTNFHLPRTTLLVLVRTFAGDALARRAYEEAIAERYRFFSYGDAMLIV